MDAPLLSVTVAALNEERYVGRALRSLHADPYVASDRDRVEILLVDSGSSDRTVEIARPFVDRVVVTGWGKLRARNAGARASRAPVLVWMDADIEIAPGSVGRLVRHFEDPKVAAVVSSTRAAHPALDAFRSIVDAAAPLVRNVNGRFGAVRRDVFERIGGFDESQDCRSLLKMLHAEQLDFGWRIAREGKIVWDREVVHMHSDRRVRAYFGAPEDRAYARSLGVDRF